MEDIEIYKDIPGYVGIYQVSNLGNIKSLQRTLNHPQSKTKTYPTIILKPYNRNGYLHISLVNDCKRKNFKVHRIVAKVFIENKDEKPCVNHKDGNKKNNIVSNLEWVTVSENHKHAYKSGLRKIKRVWLGKLGKNHNASKPIFQLDLLGNIIRMFYGTYEAQRITGINKSNITQACKGRYKTAGGYIWKYAS